MNPYASACPIAETTAIGPQYYETAFAGGFNGAVPVSTVHFVNNVGSPTRITAGAGRVDLIAPNGSIVGAGLLTSRDVTTLTFEPSLAPIYPNPADAFQTSAASRFQHVRYVRITSSAATPLTFREVMVSRT